MRPRPEGRGELRRARVGRRQRLRASMRPRPEGRGERRPAASGGLGVQASMRPRPEGRGEPDMRSISHVAERLASMRPRPEGRGEPRHSSMALSHVAQWLQCGHGPKAVENAAAEADQRSAPELLQCGHGPKAVENVDRREYMLTADACASMRPRPEGRGEPASRTLPLAARCASMRPRPEGRGEPCTGQSPRRSEAYGFNAATARRPWRTDE